MSEAPPIRMQAVSKWYGEVLGVNRVTLDVARGITSLVGPNGCGKSTLMNLVAGLLHPSRGRIEVLGVPPRSPQRLHEVLGYCTQADGFPHGFTGAAFLDSVLRVRGLNPAAARRRTAEQLERLGLASVAARRIGSYSKGMRQRLKLALATAHAPRLLMLDEPLDGLDPVGRADMLATFRELARDGTTVLISSHVLHEVDAISDQVVMLHHGYVMADGAVSTVRSEIAHEPLKVRVRCSQPAGLAALAFADGLARSARTEGDVVTFETFDAPALCRLVGRKASSGEVEVESLDVADENVQAVYDYLIRGEEGAS